MKPLKFQIVSGTQNKDPNTNKLIDKGFDACCRKHENLHVRNTKRHNTYNVAARGLKIG